MPRNLPDYYGFGDENEAVLYAYLSMNIEDDIEAYASL